MTVDSRKKRTRLDHDERCIRDPWKASGYWCAVDCPVAQYTLSRIRKEIA